ncbi:hypothetical protein SDC9_158737 [bioreactor metagenome]|uniref:Uncharacterized protein n=1 Tax=bioreactor metagenome TaxID=1076179 RepID=A0A645FCR6_9ZZZZ
MLPDRVRVIWIHDVERPSDNYLALQMATMEHEFGFRTSYNIRFLCALTPDFRAELDAVLALSHEIQYQYEDLVIAAGDMAEARAGFRKNLAWLRSFYPDITVGFAHGVYKSGYFSGDIFKENGEWRPELITALGLRPLGELYYVIDRLSAELGLRFHYVGEDRYIGGDEFAAALREAKPGEVVMFLQHPTWWDVNYDFDELRRLVRKSAFFH